MNELPDSWAVRTLGEVNQFSSSTLNPATRPDEVFELYSVPSFPTRAPERLLGSEIGSTKQTVAPGDVLISKINPRINRVWTVGPKNTEAQIASSEWIGFRSAAVQPAFANYYFTSPDFREVLCSEVAGVGGSLTRAQPKRVAGYTIPIAPAAEQTRIADQLDTLLTRIQSCNDRFDAIPALLKRFRQAVLDTALNGAFSDNPVEGEAPRVCISSIASVGTGSTPLRSNGQFFANTGTPWITSSATSEAIIQRASEFVTPAAISAHRLKIYPKGTLLVAMYGEGKTRGQVAELGIDATINQACAAVRVDNAQALTAFVKLALQANYLNMRELAEGGNQPNLNLSKVKEFEITLPPLDVQTNIVRRVEALFALADRIEARCTAARTQAQRLTPLVLAKAFRGELVPQDPSDEPAHELLTKLASSPKARVVKDLIPPVGVVSIKTTTFRRHTIPIDMAISVSNTGWEKVHELSQNDLHRIADVYSDKGRKRSSDMTKTKSRQDADVRDKPYLADQLRRLGLATTAEELFNVSELPIADFYKQLAWEVAQGHITDGGTTLEARYAAG